MKAISDVTFPEQGKGFLDLEKVVVLLPDAARLWISDNVDLFEEAVQLPKPQLAATRVSLESDQSFTSYSQALAHFSDPPLTNTTTVVWDQTMLDILFEYPIRSDLSAFSIRPRFERLGVRVLTTLRFLPPSGAERAF